MFSEDVARLIAEQFQQAQPDDRYKRSHTVSRRELVSSLYDAIMEKRKAGFSFEGIAAHLGQLGAPMSESTLRSYLLHARRAAKAAPPAVARTHPKATGREQSTEKRRRKQPSNANGGGEEALQVVANPAMRPSAVPADGAADALPAASGAPLDSPPRSPPDNVVHVPDPRTTDWVQRAAADAIAKRPEKAETREETRMPPTPTPSFGFTPRNR